MPLIVHTAPLGHEDPDVLIISRKFNELRVADGQPGGHRDVGIHFCPSKRLQSARWRRCRFNLNHETPEEWEQYVSDYVAEMRKSYISTRKAWDTVLGWERVVIASSGDEGGADRSPRAVLAQNILEKLGASYMGEL